MEDKDKTKAQLIKELLELRQQITELKKAEAKHKRAEEALQDREEKYRSLVESSEDSIYLVNRNYKYLFMNKKHRARLGLSKAQFIGQAYSDFHLPEDTKVFIEKVDKVFETDESIQYEHRSHRDGRYFLRTLSPVKQPDGNIMAVTVVSKGITKRKRMEEELRALSLTDELTGLYNRRGFLTLAEQQLKVANRLKRGTLLLYADVDDLKSINDKFGHQEGDIVLVETANILKEIFRDSDIIARIGGDEFVVFPIETTDASAEALNVRFQKHLEVHNAKRDRNYNLLISLGIVRYEQECPYSIDELLGQADKLMYEQKSHKQKS